MTDREELLGMVSSLKEAVKTGGGKTGGAKSRAKKEVVLSPSPSPKKSFPSPLVGEGQGEGTVSAVKPNFPVNLSATAAVVDFVSDASLSPAEKLRRLREEEIGDCQRCPLGKSRIKLAFGVGNPQARVMVIGEGPGYQEDRQGEPFVGRAGQLLDKILEATGLSRQRRDPEWSWVYIANMVKCHPMIDPADNTKHGNDRPPTPEEMAVCSPFLMKQIRIIRPLFIVALGGTSGKGLLKTEEGISKFRGRWSDWSPEGDPSLKVRFLPTYHPAALLRNPSLKTVVWEDMKSLREELKKAVATA